MTLQHSPATEFIVPAAASADRRPPRARELRPHLQIPQSRHRAGHRHRRRRRRGRCRACGGRRAPGVRRPVAHDARLRARPDPAALGGSAEAAHAEEIIELESIDAGKPISATCAPGFSGRGRHADLLRRLGRQDQRRRRAGARRCLDLHRARAGRRGRGDRAVEFPADDRHVEARAGAGLRLHHRDEAGRADLAVGAAHRRARARGRPAGGRLQRRHRPGPRRRRRAGQSPRRRQGHLHRLARRRPRNHEGRGRQLQARLARARRQVGQRHLRRRRSRSGIEGCGLRHLLQCWPGVLGRLPRAGAGEGL